MRRRYQHLTNHVLNDTAAKVAASSVPTRTSSLFRLITAAAPKRRGTPPRAVGSLDVVPGEALAEDTRFELVRGVAPKRFPTGHGGVRHEPEPV
ncbi:hypothetical protein SCOCK_30299 [Actinacidiphila cocklensis]|uniref:Uncharacterized protein n=1 Tax=Actinacidiphila cocklensis TaxID=887465 RepID=A0A9W4DS48_9ACTN|nr:hypothetical protein SCOCK_30299 [Actinacidiphila cocklensis]